MTAGGGGSAAAGGPALHIPVLGAPALQHLNVHDGGVYIDGTFGAGGYTRAILEAANCKVIGIDRDQTAIALGADLVEQAQGRLTLVEDRFSNLDDVAKSCGHETVDGIVLDVGVSSMQLDQAGRGFSFRLDGPLDMRMSGEGASAADVVNTGSERDLATIIFVLGEERFSRQVARAIVKARADARIETTRKLADIVASAVRTRPTDIHPATRTFQALRIAVNDELGELAQALIAAEHVLKPGGRLAVVSFHSLEDRIVKTFLAARAKPAAARGTRRRVKRAAPSFTVLTKKPIVADEAEIARNPRARSAKLRAGERTDAPVHRGEASDLLPRVPSLDDVMRALTCGSLHILVIAALIAAATYVYKIKFDSTLQAERVAKLHGEIRKERNAIAALRAEWARLETPSRIQGLAERHLKLAPIKSTQFDSLDRLPARPAEAPPQGGDGIGAMLGNPPEATGSIPAPARR